MSLGSIGRDVPSLGLEGQVELGRVDVEVALEGGIIAWGWATTTATDTTTSATITTTACIASGIALAGAYAAVDTVGGGAIGVVGRRAAKR